MKNLVFEEVLILSRSEGRAIGIEFDKSCTVIRGENHTGKSSLIKALYSVFGAEPGRVHPTWRKAEIEIALRFRIDGASHWMYRSGSTFALFQKDSLRGIFRSVTDELAPALAKLWDIHVQVTDRRGLLITPPPAYLLLPYYIDQDTGWSENWNSFGRLQQLHNWRPSIIDFHVGIRSNEYYRIRHEMAEARTAQSRVVAQHELLRGLSLDVWGDRPEATFDIDIKAFSAAVDELLAEANALARSEELLRDRLSELVRARESIEEQIRIADSGIAELNSDFDFAAELRDSIECPTCGVVHENSFAARFGIAKDVNGLGTLRAQLQEELHENEAKIDQLQGDFAAIAKKSEAIQVVLSRRQGPLSLRMVVEAEGRRTWASRVREHHAALEQQAGALAVRLTELEARRVALDDKDHTAVTNKQYSALMKDFLSALGVKTAGSAMKNVRSKIEDTGSGLPRALLAYTYTILHLIDRVNSGTRFPIVIDAPNQQEQDPNNLKNMLEFIRDRRPENTQLVIGLVDDGGAEFPGTEYFLTEKHHLLQPDEYEVIRDQMDLFAAAIRASEARSE